MGAPKTNMVIIKQFCANQISVPIYGQNLSMRRQIPVVRRARHQLLNDTSEELYDTHLCISVSFEETY